MFLLDQEKLMSGTGGLAGVNKSDRKFDMVFSNGIDVLQKQSKRFRNPDPNYHGEFARMESCQSCHGAAGIFSMNSYIQFFQSKITLQPPDLREGHDAAWESITWKNGHYTWGLLQAYWGLAKP